MKKTLFLILFSLSQIHSAVAQIDESKMGAWYMYFYTMKFKESRFGLWGDVQYRNWNTIGNLEQLLIRAAATYKPRQGDATLAAGYAFVLSGAYGSTKTTVWEHRLHQDILFKEKIGNRFFFSQRIRIEERFIEELNFRSRFRFNFFLNVPFNQKELTKGAVYLSLYSEIFLNGERDIGKGLQVEIFDRVRLYAAAGYSITDKLKIQLGYMQQVTDIWSKGQIQLSVLQNFAFN